jgi:hypothetical protein
MSEQAFILLVWLLTEPQQATVIANFHDESACAEASQRLNNEIPQRRFSCIRVK